jgi:hypothetical protein
VILLKFFIKGFLCEVERKPWTTTHTSLQWRFLINYLQIVKKLYRSIVIYGFVFGWCTFSFTTIACQNRDAHAQSPMHLFSQEHNETIAKKLSFRPPACRSIYIYIPIAAHSALAFRIKWENEDIKNLGWDVTHVGTIPKTKRSSTLARPGINFACVGLRPICTTTGI